MVTLPNASKSSERIAKALWTLLWRSSPLASVCPAGLWGRVWGKEGSNPIGWLKEPLWFVLEMLDAETRTCTASSKIWMSEVLITVDTGIHTYLSITDIWVARASWKPLWRSSPTASLFAGLLCSNLSMDHLPSCTNNNFNLSEPVADVSILSSSLKAKISRLCQVGLMTMVGPAPWGNLEDQEMVGKQMWTLETAAHETQLRDNPHLHIYYRYLSCKSELKTPLEIFTHGPACLPGFCAAIYLWITYHHAQTTTST